jgi:protein KRI1
VTSSPTHEIVFQPQSKPLTLQQQKVQLLLGPRSPSPGPQHPTHVEEQQALRDETINAFHLAVSDDNDDNFEGGLLTLREKSKDELERQEEEYRAFLEREVGDIESLVRITSNLDKGDTSEKFANIPHEGMPKKTSKKRKDRSQDSDEQFLMKCVHLLGLTFARLLTEAQT